MGLNSYDYDGLQPKITPPNISAVSVLWKYATIVRSLNKIQEEGGILQDIISKNVEEEICARREPKSEKTTIYFYIHRYLPT